MIKRSILKDHDVLVVIAGAMVGKSAIIYQDFLPANTNQAVCFIRPLETFYSFLIYFWMQSNYIKSSIKEKSVVSAQPNLSMEDLGNFYIPLPPKKDFEKMQINLFQANESMMNLMKNIKIELVF